MNHCRPRVLRYVWCKVETNWKWSPTEAWATGSLNDPSSTRIRESLLSTLFWKAFRADDSRRSPVEGLEGYSYVGFQGGRDRGRVGEQKAWGSLFDRWKQTGNWSGGCSDVTKENVDAVIFVSSRKSRKRTPCAGEHIFRCTLYFEFNFRFLTLVQFFPAQKLACRLQRSSLVKRFDWK